jgi:hypothetical protein
MWTVNAPEDSGTYEAQATEVQSACDWSLEFKANGELRIECSADRDGRHSTVITRAMLDQLIELHDAKRKAAVQR